MWEKIGAEMNFNFQTTSRKGRMVLFPISEDGQERDDHNIPPALPLPTLRLHGKRRWLLRKIRASHSQPEDAKFLHPSVFRQSKSYTL